jgi:hypothetical protein
VLENNHPTRGQQVANRGQDVAGRLIVRRIQKNDIERHKPRSSPQGVGAPGNSRADNSIATLHAAPRQVLLDQGVRAPILFDEHDVGGATADRLDADRPGTGIPVQHPRAVDA